jgi:catalase (peroxidase I)
MVINNEEAAAYSLAAILSTRSVARRPVSRWSPPEGVEVEGCSLGWRSGCGMGLDAHAATGGHEATLNRRWQNWSNHRLDHLFKGEWALTVDTADSAVFKQGPV